MDYRQQYRARNRLYHGIRIARNEKEHIRFLTLTTSKNRVLRRKKEGDKWIRVPRTIRESFDVLKLKIKRATQEKDGFKGFKFNRYLMVRTHEGLGVLHIIWWGGRFIPKEWIRNQWFRIHGAFEIKIEHVPENEEDTQKVAHYVVSNYLQGQKIARMSYGWRWAWLGVCKSWEKVKESYGLMRRGRSSDAFFKVGEIVSFHASFSSKVWSAWRCVLWEHPIGSRQRKLTVFC